MCEMCDIVDSFFGKDKQSTSNPGISGFGTPRPPISLYGSMNSGFSAAPPSYWRAKLTTNTSDQQPAPEETAEELPDADDLSSEGRDVIGLVRTTVKIGQGQTISDLSLSILCAVHGVPSDEWESIQQLTAAIKKEAPAGKPEDIMMKALMEAFTR